MHNWCITFRLKTIVLDDFDLVGLLKLPQILPFMEELTFLDDNNLMICTVLLY
jgi:hypothetical protein